MAKKRKKKQQHDLPPEECVDKRTALRLLAERGPFSAEEFGAVLRQLGKSCSDRRKAHKVLTKLRVQGLAKPVETRGEVHYDLPARNGVVTPVTRAARRVHWVVTSKGIARLEYWNGAPAPRNRRKR